MACLVLVGCASESAGVHGGPAVGISGHALVVSLVTGAGDLPYKTNRQAFDAVTLSSQSNQHSMEVHMPAHGFKDGTLTDAGAQVEQAEGPAVAMATMIERLQAEVPRPLSAEVYRVDIEQAAWTLDRESSSVTSNYRLHWRLMSRVRDGEGNVVAISQCGGSSGASRALGTWQAHDDAEIKDAARLVGEGCAYQLMTDIGLQG
jgi:hypothetical protein